MLVFSLRRIDDSVGSNLNLKKSLFLEKLRLLDVELDLCRVRSGGFDTLRVA